MREYMPESLVRLVEADLNEIESMARENAGEPNRGPLIALVEEVRRLRGVVLGGSLERQGLTDLQVEPRG